jgi:flagellar motor protein MotB
MVLGIKSLDTRRKEEKRRKYTRKESENGKRNRRISIFILHRRG